MSWGLACVPAGYAHAWPVIPEHERTVICSPRQVAAVRCKRNKGDSGCLVYLMFAQTICLCNGIDFLMSSPRVFVAGGYLMNGGAHMAYHVGRVLHEQFRLPVFISGAKRPDNGYFDYPYDFPVISLPDMESTIRNNDILVSTGGLSASMFGLRLPGKKLCYVQGISKYEVLDGFFDRYVFTAQFVREYANRHFMVDGPVINPFIDTEIFSGGKRWEERDSAIAFLGYKPLTELLLAGLARICRENHPNVPAKFTGYRSLSQAQLADVLGRHKYYLTLSPLEGFGLPLLEAMASGCAVVGFDGCGGKEFTTNGVNALLAGYPRLSVVADNLAQIVQDDSKARKIGENAYQTSRQYGKHRFDTGWREVLDTFV